MPRNDDTVDMLDLTPAKNSGKKWVVPVVIAVIAALGIGAYAMMGKDKPAANNTEPPKASEPAAPAATPAPTAAPAPVVTPAPTPTPAPAPAVQPVETFKDTIYFANNGYALNQAAKDKLKDFWSKLEGKEGKLELGGHADSNGEESYNMELSKKRAEAVAEELKKLGLGDKFNVEVKSFGESKPAADNNTSEGRALNRRVEIAFTSGK